MKTEITEQERKAIEDAAKKCTVDYYNNVGGYHEDPVLTNGDKMRLMFRFGAEFALSELSKPKAVQNSKPNPSNICPDCGYPKTTQGNGIIERICTCGEPPEYIGQQKIHQCKVCGLIYDNSTELYEHYNETHNNPIE